MNRTSYAEPEPKLATVLGKRALVYLGILVFALALLLIFNTGNASAAGPTYVYEDITTDTTWIEADSPYIVNDSIEISPGVTLTIDPNVTVMFDNGVEMVVAGTLNALGTSDEPISFTSNGSTSWGAWGGLIFDETSTDSILDYMVITYPEAVGIFGTDVEISNTVIMNTTVAGLYIMQDDSYTATFTNLTIENVDDGPGIFAICWNGALDITLVDSSIVWTDSCGIDAEALLDVNLALIDCQINWNGDQSIYIYSDGADANLLIDGLEIMYCYSHAIEIDAINTTIAASDMIINATIGDGILAYGPGYIDIWIDPSSITYIEQNAIELYSGSNIAITLVDVSVDHTYWNAIYAEATGSISLTATNVAINDTYGVYLWAYEAVDISIDPSAITYTYGNALTVFSDNSTITIGVQDLLIEHAMGYGIYANANNSMVFTATNLEINDTWFSGIYLISNHDDGIVNAEGLSVSNANGFGLFLWANTSAEVLIYDFLFDNTGDDAVHVYANNTDMTFVAVFGFVFDANGDAFSLEAPNNAVYLTIEDVFVDGADGYFLYVESPLWTELVIEFFGVVVNDTAYVIPAVVLPGDISLILVDSSFTNIGSDCFWMFSTNGNITVDMTDSIISGADGSGIYAWAPNGWVSVFVDPSVIDGCYYGIFVDAVSIPIFDLTETTVSNCEFGVLLYADTEDLEINIVDCVFDGNTYALRADANLGSIMFDMIGTLVNDTDLTGIYLETFDGDIAVTMEASAIVGSYDGVVLLADGNVTVDLIDTTFDDSDGYGLWAMAPFGDVTLSMMGGLVNDSLDAGIYLWSGDGYVFADFYQVDFGFNWYSIYLVTELYDVDLVVDECVFTGDLNTSIYVDAGNDSFFELTENVMNGYEANENGWYFFDEIEYEYDIIDPGTNWSSADYFIYTFAEEFPFQGMTYTTAYVYENGYISLGGPQSFPVDLESPSNPVIVPCQQNFITNMYPYYGYKQYEDRVVFQWDVYVSGESSYLRNVFEVVLYENGDIQFNYAEMESVSHSVYDYGLGTSMGPINVGQIWLTADPFDNDWTSYFFTASPMSGGVAAWVESENNNTAWIYDNTISNYFYGGVNCYADEGWVWIDAVNNSFSHMVTGFDSAALLGWADDNTIWANAQDNDFAYIVEIGIAFVSGPWQGGVDEIVVVNNTFQDVSMLAIAAVNMLWDYDGNSTLTYTSTKTITDNVGVNSGMIYVVAEVYSENSSLDITVTDLITRNVFTGYPKMYTSGILGDIPLQPGFGASISCYVYMETEAKESTLTHTADVTENTHVPINTGFMAGSSGIFVYDEVYAYESVIALISDIEIAGNTLVGEWLSFDVGIGATVYGAVSDGDLTMDVTVDINDNFVECVPEYGNYGVMVNVELYDDGGEGSGALNATVLIWENTIINFWEGIYEYVEAYMWNFWGDFEATVDTLITQNWIEAYDCIYIYLYAECGFSSYFPSYEEEIWSSVTADYLTTITENDMFADYYAVYLYYDAYAREDGYGTFANALVDFVNEIVISDNLIESSYYGIELYGDAYARSGEAEVWSDTKVEIFDNTLVGVEYDGPIASGVAIEVYEYAEAYSETYDFDDSPVVYDTFVVGVYDNTIENFQDGIYVWHDLESRYGLSYVDAISEIGIVNNEMAIEDYGAYAGIYADDYQSSQLGFASNATIDVLGKILIENNIVTIFAGEELSLDTGIYVDFYSDTAVTYEFLAEILSNDITGDYDGEGIYTYADTDATNALFVISENVITMCEYGIESYYGMVEITNNAISDCIDEGMYLHSTTGTVMYNTVVDCYYGIDMYTVFDMVVADNEITTSWELYPETGIYVYSSWNLTVENNLVDGFYYGIEMYYVYESWFMGNSILDSLDLAVYIYECYMVEFSDNLVQTGFSDGMDIYYSEFITIADNTISDFMGDGLYLYGCYDCVIADNEIFAIAYDGLSIYSCYDIVLINGIFYDCDYAIWGSSYSMTWIIDGVAEVRNCPVYFEGDVTVVDGGWLNLDFVSCFELYDDWYDGVPALTVEEGGLLTATNTCFGDEEPWLFDVYGTMEMDNSWVYEAYQLYCGPTSDVTIHASSIWYNQMNGVYIDDCSPVLAFVDISYNEKAGVFITGENADPEIKDCIISFNERGIYANEASLGQVIDNLIFYNYMTGIYVDSVVGEIHDNILLFNQREIFVMDSVLSIEDNQIGYSYLVEVMSDYWPMLMGSMGETSLVDWSFDPEDIMSLMTNHIGVYVENSVVECSGNVYGMLSYALYAVESDVLFMDSVEMFDLVIPYFDEYYAMYNITLPIFVYDGIFASDSTLVVADAYIEVLDDAIFLEATDATVDSCVLVAGDFDIYAMDGSEVDVIGGDLDKVKAEDDTEIGLWYTMTIYTVDPDGNPVDVWVMVFDSVHTYPIAEGNSSDGVFTAQVMAGMWTSSGEDTSMNPYTAYASFDGGNADQTVTVDGDVEITLQDPGPESPHIGTGFGVAVAVIAGILVVIGILTLAVRP